MSQPELNLSLRPVCLPDDEQFLRGLYASRRDDLQALPLDPTQIEGLISMQYEAQDRGYRDQYPGAEHYIVEVDGRAAGRYLINRSDHLEDLAVDLAILPELRGRGIGTKILSDSIDEARRAGKNFTLQVDPANPALQLYLKLGAEVRSANETAIELTWAPGEPRETNG